MDGRIPPTGPRRSASLPTLRRASTPAAPSHDGETVLAPVATDTVAIGAQPVHPRTVPSSPTLASPRLTSTQAHGNLSQPLLPSSDALVFELEGHVETEDGQGTRPLNAQEQQRILESFVEAANMQGVGVDPASDDLFAVYGGLLFGLVAQLLGESSPQAPDPKTLQAVVEARHDVAGWYRALDPEKTASVRVGREDDYSCGISRKPFHEIEHPVAAALGQAVHVFEAEDLLGWMQTSMETAGNDGVALHPVDMVTPLDLTDLVRAKNVLFGPVGPARA